MADNTTLSVGAGGDTIATDDIGGIKHQLVKVEFGAADSATQVSSANPLPITAITEAATAADGGTLPAVQKVIAGYDGTNVQAVKTDTIGRVAVTDDGTSVSVDDNSGSLTVDAPVGTPVFTRLSDGAATLIGQKAMASSLPVAIASDQSAVPVSGTVTANAGTGPFPVSDNAGSLTVDAPVGTPAFVRLSDGAAAITALPVTDNAGSLTVDAPVATPLAARLSDGAAFLTTTSGRLSVDASGVAVPVTDNAGSLTIDAPVGTPVFARLSDGAATLIGQKVMASSLPVAIASDQSAVSVTPPTLTKATQGSTGFSTQDLKDAGRVALQFYANGVASGTTTTETAITLTKAADTGATSSAVSFVITSGKRFRITSISVASRGNATGTAQITTFSLRVNTAGAVTTASTPIVFQAASACAATASAWDRVIIPIPDGYEILGNGTIQFGLTANAVFVTNAPTWFANITGFEY